MQVYFDNAATTPLNSEVISVMHDFMLTHYGNPSSTHSKGREARVELEKARKKIASIVGTHEKEIIFTSGGTEGNNLILKSLALEKSITRIISSPIEHHSVLDTLDWIKKHTEVDVQYLDIDKNGHFEINQLKELLQVSEPTLVSLMHGNNEIGNLIDLNEIGTICHHHNALFHSDMVQTLGHYSINLKSLPIDFATCSAHKIHGPKGVGFIYINSKASKMKSFMHGGEQERGIRGGTENGIGIIGMSKAFELAHESIDKDQKHILSLKNRMLNGLTKHLPQAKFNGDSGKIDKSLNTLINIQLPGPKDNTLLFNLDLKGIALSEGSACSSGASKGSHVLKIMGQTDEMYNNLRVSFSKLNTINEVEYTISAIKEVTNEIT